jgi:hypothetical protein
MKKFFLISTAIIITATIFYSCKKDAANITTEEQAVQQLLQSENFVDFSKSFIPDVTSLLMYHRSIKIQHRSDDFLKQVSLANNDESQLANTYQAFSLNFENAVLLKNKIDNDLLQLFNRNNFLSQFNEIQTQNIILNALDAARTSTDPKWQQVKEEINNSMRGGDIRVATQSIRLNLVDVGTGQPGVSWDEVWGCIREAIGFGAGGILGVAAIKNLAGEGFQQIVITVSKFLAKHAGWFGLAIAVIDFSSCLYHESKD